MKSPQVPLWAWPPAVVFATVALVIEKVPAQVVRLALGVALFVLAAVTTVYVRWAERSRQAKARTEAAIAASTETAARFDRAAAELQTQLTEYRKEAA